MISVCNEMAFHQRFGGGPILRSGVWYDVDRAFYEEHRSHPGLVWHIPTPAQTQRRSMRIVVPYACRNQRWLRDEVIERLGGVAEFVDVSGSDAAYSELFGALWTEKRDFCLNEHDVVPDLALLDEFETCQEPWCCAVNASLGCVRFRRALMEAVPVMPTAVARQMDVRISPGHWQCLDQAVYLRLEDAGFVPHHHDQAVEHLHDYSRR